MRFYTLPLIHHVGIVLCMWWFCFSCQEFSVCSLGVLLEFGVGQSSQLNHGHSVRCEREDGVVSCWFDRARRCVRDRCMLSKKKSRCPQNTRKNHPLDPTIPPSKTLITPNIGISTYIMYRIPISMWTLDFDLKCSLMNFRPFFLEWMVRSTPSSS